MVAEHVMADCMTSMSREGPLMNPLFTAVELDEPGLLEARVLNSSALRHRCIVFICTLAIIFFWLLLGSGATRLV
jgi:hypothetical protein